MKNLLIAAYKQPFISSNAFLSILKKRIGEQKAGFSGILDPFASGLLIVAFGAYTKLLSFLPKSPKTYRATLWLGADSQTLDIEGVKSVENIAPFEKAQIARVLDSLKGEITYTPPSFSAKHINGVRAYKLAREGKEVALREQKMQVYALKLLHYNHPFVNFEVSLSEGGYVRSLGALVCESLGVKGALSALQRVGEGRLRLEQNERGEFLSLCADGVDSHKKSDLRDSFVESKSYTQYNKISFYPLFNLNPLSLLPYPRVIAPCAQEDAYNGKKMLMTNTESGIYKWLFKDFFSLVQVREGGEISYLYNRIPYADTF
ncbi:tRNA pseudouridine(55) synthase TruB [Helicobacter sp. MIT 00-7814]|uniref:tRNA pseudouridine(55) synthase TruB n=1 Tax=unclassified Helicobacter TaxID=2593540 RepID=UPI000E1E5D0E|nr:MULTISPECIES: tRNA pseudouridine(55) synthase TruB [unclassified Helicobacter]RDU55008.1 tRNA pseudouridine(55) synthase TruB [Helicobacter sp. MIT 00-7814]RDU55961.1 tRNA pseudouridine(55) synthase TruB [Helicobacter sp. MIT 99-10781]